MHGNLVRAFHAYETPADTVGTPLELPWSEWVAALSQHDVRGTPADRSSPKKALDAQKWGPALVFGRMRPGSTRSIEAVLEVHALGLDFDAGTEAQVEAALAALGAYEWICWTTHKHGSTVAAGRPRLRVVLPLAEPLHPSRHLALWEAANALVGGIVDPSTKDVCRLHYLPSTFDPALAWSLHNEGDLLDLLPVDRRPATTPAHPAEELAEPSVDPVEVAAQVRKVRAALRRLATVDELRPAATALWHGEPFASSGERHVTMRALTWWMAEKWPDLHDQTIIDLFAPSIAATEGTHVTADAAVVAYRGAIEKQLERNPQPGNGERYAHDELETIADVQGWRSHELERRWLIQKDSTIYLLGSGGYIGPYSRDETPTAVVTDLARAPVDLYEPTKSGWRPRTILELLRDHGTVAVEVVADLTRQVSTFDARTHTMFEAARPWRLLDPLFDPGIHEWLLLLGGEQCEKLIDWIACVPDCSRLLCALYLGGKKGAGKGLLANGLARIWRQGPPAELERIVGDFNEDAAQCPLLFADEALPKVWKAKPITATLRQIIGSFARTLSRKHRPPATLNGNLRLILAANNDSLIKSDEVATSEDLEAVAQRFLFIRTSAAAADAVEQMSHETKARWVEGDALARHAMWLYSHRRVERGLRFWVEGDVSQMHRLLMTSSHWNSLVCEWLVRYLLEPHQFDSAHTGLIRRVEKGETAQQVLPGDLLVNDDALIKHWSTYLGHVKSEPLAAKVGTALRAISTGGERRQLRHKKLGSRIRYRVIDVNHLIAWAEDHGIGHPDDLRRAVGICREPGSDDDEDTGDEALIAMPTVNTEAVPF